MKTIVVAPYQAHQNLIKKYRESDPFVDVRFFSKSSLLKEVYYQYDDDALLYLIKKHNIDPDLANEYLSIIKKLTIKESNSPKIDKLLKLKKELLDNNLLFKNEYIYYELEHARIDVYFYSEKDVELLNVLKGCDYHFHINEEKAVEVHNFATNVDELTFVFNKICELISSGVKASDISLFGLSDADELAFIRLRDNFHLNFNNSYPKTYLSKNYIARFLNDLNDLGFDKAFEEAKNNAQNDELFADFERIIARYRLEKNDSKIQAVLYKRIFGKMRLPQGKFVDAINIVNEPIVKDDGYLFIVNFVQGKFPTICRDDGFVSNAEKASAGLVTTNNENLANLELFKQYLMQNANIFVSYSNRNYSEKYAPSPFVKLLNIKPIIHHEILTYYSFDEANLTYANLKDLKKNYLDDNPMLKSFEKTGIKIPYQTYDYSFNGVRHFVSELPLSVSYSQIKSFYECQYKYYLGNILKIDDKESNLALNIGDLSHHIFERLSENKEFDVIYEEELSKLENEFDKYDWVFLTRIKEEIRKTFIYIKQFESQINNPKIARETKGSKNGGPINLDTNLTLDGRIDKTICFGPNQEYLFIIDYKSGHDEFNEANLPYNLCLQLPTYALIAKESDQFKDKTLAGLFIQRFLVNKEISSFVNPDNESLPLLEGVYLADADVIKNVDSSLSFEPSKYIKSCKLRKDGMLSSNRAKTTEYMSQLAENARNAILNAAHSIKSNEFGINPKIVSGKNKSCSYCPYRDICYRDEKSFVILSNDGGEEDAAD